MSVTSSGHGAPAATQLRTAATCSAESAGPPLGIAGSGPEIYVTRRLSSGLLGTIAGLLSPPAASACAETSDSPPLGLCTVVAREAALAEKRRNSVLKEVVLSLGGPARTALAAIAIRTPTITPRNRMARRWCSEIVVSQTR